MSALKKMLSFPLALWLITPNLLAAGGRVHDKDHVSALPSATTQPTQTITPYVAPEVIDRVNITTAGDFLWWKSYLGGMEFAVSGVVDGGTLTQTSINRGKVKKPPFEWAPGIKLTLGIDYRLDGWNTTATYTGLFTDREHGSVTYDATKGLATNVSLEYPPTFFGAYATYDATCSWRQKFNILDLELARNFFICRTLTLRPNFGLKLSWIEEKFDINYKVRDAIVTNVTNAAFEMNQRQWGLGVRGGINTVWRITREFGVYGDVAATAMWSSFKNHIDEQLTTSANGVTTVSTQLTNDGHLYEVIPVLEMGLGFDYSMWFNNNTCLFFARAGWEEQVWSNFNQFVLPLNRMHGNLSVHGLTIKLGFTY